MQFSLTVIFTTLLAIGVNAQLEATASTLATAILPAAALTQIVVATNVVASEITAVGYKVPVPNVRQDNSGEETSELTVVTYKARVPKFKKKEPIYLPPVHDCYPGLPRTTLLDLDPPGPRPTAPPTPTPIVKQ
ncbi:hypothetical protein EG327_003359 [Venturia inaequalis]|uniref:Uncharacterized protein n=1 Tax=Venturia inaequalis TaxID=5025 RepID=A0A8H3VKD0_VENIN|nr:hypothetical protein EG327_003359 [Venturia inaequalis]